MPKYSPQSEGRLSGCHKDLRKLFSRVLERVDHTIECGHRGRDEQNQAKTSGNSTKKWPNSKHNSLPSEAVDAMPYPYSWAALEGKSGPIVQMKALLACGRFIGYVLRVAEEMYDAGEISSQIVNGTDWDGDWNVQEHSFIDIPHFERRKVS